MIHRQEIGSLFRINLLPHKDKPLENMDGNGETLILHGKISVTGAPLAQLDRALVCGTRGQGFESLGAHQ